VFENSLKREISNKTAAMIVELARRFALESSFQTRPVNSSKPEYIELNGTQNRPGHRPDTARVPAADVFARIVHHLENIFSAQ
jgi:hypothetical protein